MNQCITRRELDHAVYLFKMLEEQLDRVKYGVF